MTDYYYKCLPRRYYEHGDYTLEAVQPEHIEKIRIWRNEQMDVLRQPKPILKEQQIQYYEKHIWSELKSNQPKNKKYCTYQICRINTIQIVEREPVNRFVSIIATRKTRKI